MDRGMKFISVLFSIGILAGPMAGSFVLAQETPQAPKESGAPTPADKPPVSGRRGKLTNIKAVVTEVDPGTNSIKVKEGSKEGNKEYMITLTDKTIVTVGKIKKSVSEIRPGDKIVARVLTEGDKVTARSIRLSHERKGRRDPATETKKPNGMKETDKPAEAPQNSESKTPGSSNGGEGAPKAGE